MRPTAALASDTLVQALTAAGVPTAELTDRALRPFDALRAQPVRLQRALRTAFEAWCPTLLVRSTLDQRLLLVERVDGSWLAADLAGRPLSERAWPHWTRGRLAPHDPDRAVSNLELNDEAEYRLTRPRVLISALYHPEFFPLPRFPLGISDLARAARASLLGEVELMDMQLGATIESITAAVASDAPDILGISATFGQHDLMVELLDALHAGTQPPLVIAGGSLTARNERMLLERYPDLLVARGAGESTIADLLAYWHRDITLGEVRGLGYHGAAHGHGTLTVDLRRTATQPNRMAADYLPELDLLEETFARHGVAQIELSRGCTSACSFCPRGHKGLWAGSKALDIAWLLPELDAVFQRHPQVSRTLYAVDEEFIGRGPDAVPRALALADTLHAAGFRWETSCRVDQVARTDQDRAWHIERAVMWRALVERGLRRCLFGVESGVDSILERFNKETTSMDNALAVRSLSALGVPTRFTYITFDPLMSLAELEASYAFQGRTDLLMRRLPELDAAAVVDGVRDEDFVTRNAAGQPFYTGISYLLVSMECLVGAAYTRLVQAAGLAGAARPSMGRLDADYADWRIGAASARAQLWVDRNFPLDYTLKSLEKILDGSARDAVREARVVLKQAAYDLLGQMIDGIRVAPRQSSPRARELLDAQLGACADLLISDLQVAMAQAATQVRGVLPAASAALLDREVDRWLEVQGWTLINAAEACGT